MPLWMRVMSANLIFGTLLFATVSAFADSSRCYSIQNRDQRNFCLAQAKGAPSYCYAIQNRAAQNLCLAQTKGEKSYCYAIQDRDLKNHCLALF